MLCRLWAEPYSSRNVYERENLPPDLTRAMHRAQHIVYLYETLRSFSAAVNTTIDEF